MTGTFTVPRGTVIRGDGYDRSQIFWTDVWNEQAEVPEGGTHWSPTRTPDGMFTLEAARCLGCCGLAPVMMIDDQVYGRLVPADIKGIIDKVRAE